MKYEPTADHRKIIQGLAERQIAPADMVLLLERHDSTVLSEAQLLEHFRFEIDMGGAIGRLSIAEDLTKSAKAGNVAAQIFLSKVHLGWTETGARKSPGDDATANPPAALPNSREMGRLLRIPVRSSRRSSE